MHNDTTVRSTFDWTDINWEREAVMYLNVPAETHTTRFSRHHRCFDRQSYWRHPGAILLAPTRKEITPLHWLRVCLTSAAVQRNAKWMSSLSSDGKWWKPTTEKISKASPKCGLGGGDTSETSTQSLQYFESSAVKNEKQSALLRNLGVSRHCAHQHCSIQGEWRQCKARHFLSLNTRRTFVTNLTLQTLNTTDKRTWNWLTSCLGG